MLASAQRFFPMQVWRSESIKAGWESVLLTWSSFASTTLSFSSTNNVWPAIKKWGRVLSFSCASCYTAAALQGLTIYKTLTNNRSLRFPCNESSAGTYPNCLFFLFFSEASSKSVDLFIVFWCVQFFPPIIIHTDSPFFPSLCSSSTKECRYAIPDPDFDVNVSSSVLVCNNQG